MHDSWLEERRELDEFPKGLRRFKRHSLVQVDWIDSTAFGGWRHPDDWKDRAANKCRTVGFLLSQDAEAIHLASSLDNVGHCCERQTIPRGCVKAIRRLEVKDARQK